MHEYYEQARKRNASMGLSVEYITLNENRHNIFQDLYEKNDHGTAREICACLDLLEQNSEQMQAGKKDPTYMAGAFLYELINQEYAINYEGAYRVIGAFFPVAWDDYKSGEDYLIDAGEDSLIPAYRTAMKAYHELTETWC